MTILQQIITIAAVVLGTMVTRFLPFIVFPEGKEPPRVIQYLGGKLPYAVIGLLVVYCLKDAPASSTHGLPEAIAILCGPPSQVEKEYAPQHRRRHDPLYVAGTDGILRKLKH